jgi:hypothetical protein
MNTIITPQRKLISVGGFGSALDLSGSDDHGYNQSSDVLVRQTLDGVDYATMWRDYARAVALHNAERSAIVQFLSFPVSQPAEYVTQLSGAKFERATEYGEPRGIRQKPTSWWLGYTFDEYDIAERFTWKFLANAQAAQVDALFNSVLEADSQLMFQGILEALFINTNRTADIDNQPYNVYSLYNADGVVPPTYKSNTFDGTHTHYLASGAATVDPGDLEAMIEHLRHHGYSQVNGVQIVIGVNSAQGKTIRTFRMGTGGALFDFIPSTSEATSLILEPGQQVSGGRPASSYRGLNVIGSYGEALIVEDDLFPPLYMVAIGTGGRDNLQNPVGIREHQNADQRGLRLIKGRDNDYPLTDAFFMRSFGTGVRQRGGAVVMKITTGSYAPPTQYLY